MTVPKWQILNDRYELLCELGEGGMASVYKARDLVLNRLVAIKVMHSCHSDDKFWLQRLKREARLLSELRHKHIVGVYAMDQNSRGEPFIICEYLEGHTLRNLLQGPSIMSWQLRMGIVAQVAEAMQYAHQHKVIHRDLKPENIFLTQAPEPNFVKVLDFGLATSSSSLKETLSGITKTGEIMGTAAYMAPEVFESRPLDERSDIYSLGCIAFELLTGQAPFQADSALGLVYKHVHQKAPPVSTLTTMTLPEELDQIIEKCLAKEPEQRFQNMAELKTCLDNILEIEPQHADIANSTKRLARKTIPKAKLISIICICLAIPLGCLVAFSNKVSSELWLYKNVAAYLPASEQKKWEQLLFHRLINQGKTAEAKFVFAIQLRKYPPASWDMNLLAEQLLIAKLYAKQKQNEAAKKEIQILLNSAENLYHKSLPANAKNTIEYCKVLNESILILSEIRRLLPNPAFDYQVKEAQTALKPIDRTLNVELAMAKLNLYELCFGNNSDPRANCMIDVSRALFDANRLDEAMLWAKKLEHTTYSQEPANLKTVQVLQGDIYSEKKDYRNALKCYQQAAASVKARYVSNDWRFRNDAKICRCFIALGWKTQTNEQVLKLLRSDITSDDSWLGPKNSTNTTSENSYLLGLIAKEGSLLLADPTKSKLNRAIAVTELQLRLKKS